MEGIVSNIQRFSMHDGPGVRSTIFFKGCPLRCVWCHNPETFHFGSELRYKVEDCMQCMHCVSVCESGALRVVDGRLIYDPTKCTRCFSCTYHCPTTALAKIGTHMTVVEVLSEVEADIGMYKKTGGGVTLSGGEPTAQFEFAAALLGELKARGIHVTLDTCGLCDTEKFMTLARNVDLILFDLKHADSDKHNQLTGSGNQTILKNFAALNDIDTPIEVRIPIVPGLNDDQQCLRLATIIKQNKNVHKIMLLGYHALGRSKIRAFDQTGDDLGVIPPTREELSELSLFLARATDLEVGYR